MPNPGDSTHTQLPAEDAFLGLLIETLDNLDRSARGQFLQRFFKTVTQLELTDTQSRSEEHTSELQSRLHLVCRLLLEKKKNDRPNSDEHKQHIIQEHIQNAPCVLENLDT